MKENLCNTIVHGLKGLKPTLLMIMVKIAFAVANVLYKLAVNDGMNLRIVVAYRFIFATLFIAPLAFILERLIHLSFITPNIHIIMKVEKYI